MILAPFVFYCAHRWDLFSSFYPPEDLMREELQKWTFRDMQRNTVQQDNGFNCGLFVYKGYFDSCRD